MTITVRGRRDSIFTSGAHVLVNPVNCVGVSGAGLAKLFAQRFPLHQVVYEQVCHSGLLVPGKPFLLRMAGDAIVFFPTKDHFRASSKKEWVVQGLEHLHRILPSTALTLAIPAIGCGLGGLPWSVVEFEIRRVFQWENGQNRHLIIYPPHE